ncbi:MAG: ABC transporter permease [Oscillospiraceae bacterium]|nr:ABC transporter permease [Oscillospiraceae bacterium]
MLLKFLRDLKKYWPYTVQAAMASLKAEVAGSYLNWLWWILNPLSFMVIYSLIFGVVFRAAEPYFPLYVFIGITVWEFFNHVIVHSVSMIKDKKNLLVKIYIPKFVLILSDMVVNAVKMAISFGVIAVMMLLYRVKPGVSVLYVVPVLLCTFLFTFGIGSLIMHFGVYIQDLISVVNIALRLLFYLTGVFYNVETRIPAPFNYIVLRLNPMAAFITQIREALLFGRVTHWGLLLAWFALGAVLAVFAVQVVYRNENGYIKVV